MNMNAVGIDGSKGKSMVAILRPYGEIVSTPFEVKHQRRFDKTNCQTGCRAIKYGFSDRRTASCYDE